MKELNTFRQFLAEGSELGQKLAAVIKDDIGQGESIGYDRLLTRIATAMENASDNAEVYDLLIDLANTIGKMTGDFGADSNYLDAANINLEDYNLIGQKLANAIKDDVGQGESKEYDMLLTQYANLIKNAPTSAEAYKLLVQLADKIGDMTGDSGADSNYLDAANINLKDYGINPN